MMDLYIHYILIFFSIKPIYKKRFTKDDISIEKTL